MIAMVARRANPKRVKLHRSYSISELALCCGIHKNTVRHWQAKGLEPVDSSRPTLFHGGTVRAFLAKAKASRKRPCPPGTLYCLRCRVPRQPALGMVDFVPISASSGNLRAICAHCETVMHRRTRSDDLGKVMPDRTVQITKG
jgi:hypothetical protein